MSSSWAVMLGMRTCVRGMEYSRYLILLKIIIFGCWGEMQRDDAVLGNSLISLKIIISGVGNKHPAVRL